MNIQAMMKQAQAMQKDMMKIKEEVDNTEFTGENSLVKVIVNGKKEVVKVDIQSENLEKDDIDMLEDMILLAVNDANKKVDAELEKKMGKFGNIPGLF